VLGDSWLGNHRVAMAALPSWEHGDGLVSRVLAARNDFKEHVRDVLDEARGRIVDRVEQVIDHFDDSPRFERIAEKAQDWLMALDAVFENDWFDDPEEGLLSQLVAENR
jgi:hypothetical protein